MTLNLIQKGTYHPINIESVEEKYGAVYMGYWTINTKYGWNPMPVEVFYQPNPKTELGHSSYFGIYLDQGKAMICDAKSFCPEDGIAALKYSDEILASRYRHDMRSSQDGKCVVDGGRDYLRVGDLGTYGRLFADDDKFIFIALDSLTPEDVELKVNWLAK
jgi:hypothetical protein